MVRPTQHTQLQASRGYIRFSKSSRNTRAKTAGKRKFRFCGTERRSERILIPSTRNGCLWKKTSRRFGNVFPTYPSFSSTSQPEKPPGLWKKIKDRRGQRSRRNICSLTEAESSNVEQSQLEHLSADFFRLWCAGRSSKKKRTGKRFLRSSRDPRGNA